MVWPIELSVTVTTSTATLDNDDGNDEGNGDDDKTVAAAVTDEGIDLIVTAPVFTVMSSSI